MNILAIESAIGGGSISLLRGDDEVANWTGTSNISKAEDLLFNIDALLTGNNIGRHEIGMIAVSAGPGSFTGIRIGIATALGLTAGLGIEMSSESALTAMAFSCEASGKLIAAVPVGRNAICIQTFQKKGSEVVAVDEPHAITEDELSVLVQNEKGVPLILHSALYENAAHSPAVINFGSNIAYAIAQICRENAGVITEPLFISKSF